eukprot:scaffold3347_cov382-Prasinococcus_capsulatus_cf.AAC.2
MAVRGPGASASAEEAAPVASFPAGARRCRVHHLRRTSTEGAADGKLWQTRRQLRDGAAQGQKGPSRATQHVNIQTNSFIP